MNNLEIIVLLIVYAGIIAGAIGGFILWNYMKEETEENNECINFMSHKYGLTFRGDVVNVEEGPFGRKRLTLQPKDRSLKEIIKNERKDKIRVYVDKFHHISIARGSLSKGKNIDLIWPSKASEINPMLLEMPFGKALAFTIELQNSDKTVQKALLNGMRSQASHLEEINAGEVSKEQMKRLQEIYFDMAEAFNSTKKDKPVDYRNIQPNN